MEPDLTTAEELNLLRSYLATFQSCQKCGLCFQNRHTVYRGTTPLCQRCRQGRVPGVVIHYTVTDFTVAPPVSQHHTVFVAMKHLDVDAIASLKALHRTTVRSQKIVNEEGLLHQVNRYADDRGAYFHEAFPSNFLQSHYSPLKHDIVAEYEYAREIYADDLA